MRFFSSQSVLKQGKLINLLNTSAFFLITELESAVSKIARICKFSNLKNYNIFISHTQSDSTKKTAKLLQAELEKRKNFAFVSSLLLNSQDWKKIAKHYEIDFFFLIKKNDRNDNIVLEVFDRNCQKISLNDLELFKAPKITQIPQINDKFLIKLLKYNVTKKNKNIKSNVVVYVDDPLSFQDMKRFNSQKQSFDSIYFPNRVLYEKDLFINKRLQYSLYARTALLKERKIFFSIKSHSFHALLVKYHRRIKTLSLEKLILIYLHWKSLNYSLKNSAIIVSSLTNNAIKNFAKILNLKIIHSNFEEAHLQKIYSENEVLLAYDGLSKISFEKPDIDLAKMIVIFSEMAKNLLAQEINLFSLYKEIYEKTGNWLLSKQEDYHSYETNELLVSKVTELKALAGQKIINKKTFSLNNEKIVTKFTFAKKQWIALIRDAYNPHKLIILTEAQVLLKTKSKKNLNQGTFFYRALADIEDYTPVNLQVKIRKRDIFKYFFLISLLIIITSLSILFIYKSNAQINIFIQLRDLSKTLNYGAILILLASWVLTFMASAFLRYLLLRKIGLEPRFRSTFLVAFVSAFIAFITPFQIGGDFFAFWYLKRKGLKPSKLASTFITTTIIYQLGLLLTSIIFLSSGFSFYATLYSHNVAILSTFIGASAFSIISIIFTFSVSLNAPLQNWAVTNFVKFLEIIPLWIIEDPFRRVIKSKNDFNNLRKNLIFIWKKPFFLFFLILLEILPRLIIGIAFVNIVAGFLRDDLPLGMYFSQVISFNTIYNINSLSFTPGGAGSFEALYIYINSLIYKNNQNQAANLASLSDLYNKVFGLWPIIFLSFSLLIITIGGERKLSYLKKHNKNVVLTQEGTIKTTNYFKISALCFLFLTLIVIVIIYLFAYL